MQTCRLRLKLASCLFLVILTSRMELTLDFLLESVNGAVVFSLDDKIIVIKNKYCS